MFGSIEKEVGRGWTKIHNEDHHNLYSLSGIVREIKSRRIKWLGHAAHIGTNEKSINSSDQESSEEETILQS
jgi:hypothetical protein